MHPRLLDRCGGGGREGGREGGRAGAFFVSVGQFQQLFKGRKTAFIGDAPREGGGREGGREGGEGGVNGFALDGGQVVFFPVIPYGASCNGRTETGGPLIDFEGRGGGGREGGKTALDEGTLVLRNVFVDPEG